MGKSEGFLCRNTVTEIDPYKPVVLSCRKSLDAKARGVFGSAEGWDVYAGSSTVVAPPMIATFDRLTHDATHREGHVSMSAAIY